MLKNDVITRFASAVMDLADSPENGIDCMATMLQLAVAHLGVEQRSLFFADDRVTEMLENFCVEQEDQAA